MSTCLGSGSCFGFGPGLSSGMSSDLFASSANDLETVSDLHLSSCRSTSSSDLNLGWRRRRTLRQKWSEGRKISG